MSEGWLASTMQTINNRAKSPLWGFIILAWIWFNWPNLAMLFMSDAPVKFRIDFILLQEHFYLHYVLTPVFYGVLLAIITPYAQWLLSLAQRWATDKHSENIYLIKEREYKDSIRLSGLKVRVARAEEKENAKIDADIKAEVERGKREELVTEDLQAAKKKITDEVASLKENVVREKDILSKTEREKDNLQDLIVALLEIMNEFFKVDNSRAFQELKDKAEELLTVSDFEASAIRNALKQNKELTQSQTLKMLDMVEERIKLKKAESDDENSMVN